MNIPPKYEDVVAQLEAALGREAALREELETEKLANYNAKVALKAASETCELWKGRTTNLTHTNSALQQRLTGAEQRAGELEQLVAEIAAAPEYLLPGACLSEVDSWEWFRWNGDSRPINKRYLCDVVLKDGRVLFDQSPHDFDWGFDGDVLAARHRGEHSALKPAEEGEGS